MYFALLGEMALVTFSCTPLFQAKVDDFLELVSSTVQSFHSTYSDGLPQESSQEVQFVLALCGTITSKQPIKPLMNRITPIPIPVLFIDIGASGFGREYLSSHATGHTLIDVFCSILSETPISSQW